MNEDTILTRQELYEKVWSRSMVQLAKEFGISDRGLAKICERYNVPRPSLGYWAKLEAGKNVVKNPLPSNSKLDMEKITINPLAEYIVNQQGKKHSVYLKSPISISNNTTELHSEIAKASKYGLADYENRGLFRASQTCFDISVGKSSFHRALLIIDAIIKAVEKRGHKFALVIENKGQPWESKNSFFEIKGEKVFFSIKEKVNMKKLTADGQKHSWQNHNYIPTGKLKFFVKTAYWARDCYEETEHKKLEQKLPFIIKSILKAADSYKKSRIEQKIREKVERERQKKAWEEQERREKEQQHIERLEKGASNWHKAETIRAFLNDVKDKALKKYGHINDGSEMDLWLKWGFSYADEIDPVVALVGLK